LGRDHPCAAASRSTPLITHPHPAPEPTDLRPLVVPPAGRAAPRGVFDGGPWKSSGVRPCFRGRRPGPVGGGGGPPPRRSFGPGPRQPCGGRILSLPSEVAAPVPHVCRIRGLQPPSPAPGRVPPAQAFGPEVAPPPRGVGPFVQSPSAEDGLVRSLARVSGSQGFGCLGCQLPYFLRA